MMRICLLLVAYAQGKYHDTGVRYAGTDDVRHLYEARTEPSTMWSSALAADFQVMHYDQEARRVMGYQKSTGRVFVQGTRLAHATKARHTNGVLIRVPPTAQERTNSTECILLDLAGTARWSESTAITSALWRMSHAADTLKIQSSNDEDWRCACDVSATTGALRNTGVLLVTGCSPIHADSGLHPEQGWHTHRNDQRVKCEALQTTLKHAMVIAAERGILAQPGPCWKSAIERPARPATIHLYDEFGKNNVPKAVLAVEIKHAILSMNSATAALVHAQTHALAWAQYALQQLRLGNSTVQLPDAINHTQDQCRSDYSRLLVEFLETDDLAFTPEFANLTLVVHQSVAYVLSQALCQIAFIRRVLLFWECSCNVLHVRCAAPDGVIHAFYREVNQLQRALMHRSDAGNICTQMLAVASSSLTVATLATQNIDYLKDTSKDLLDQPSTAASVWCCSLQKPTPLIQMPDIKCA
jgi:hypothetical protein